MSSTSNEPSYWNHLAQLWSLLGSPLRPHSQDVLIASEAASNLAANLLHRSNLQALLLGVTPELASMSWPEGTHLTAADLEPGMLAKVWPGDSSTRTSICADWLSLPFPDAAFDFVLGDGCLVLLEYPDAYIKLAHSLRRCIRDDGRLMLRIFCRPSEPETLQSLLYALDAKAIKSFDAFKWRLIMAVQGNDVYHGAVLADVWRAWHRLVPDAERFAQEQGWPMEKVGVIDAYRDNPARYTYPSLQEVEQTFSGYFQIERTQSGQYELAERCPHVLFRPA